MAALPAVTWNLGAATEYVIRGVSQTGGRPEGFAGVDLTWKHSYASLWTSNVDFGMLGGGRATEEIDAYGGVRREAWGFDLDAGAILYLYAGHGRFSHLGYGEVYGKASRTWGPVSLGTSLYYSPNFFDRTGSAWYGEGTVAYAISSRWTLSGSVGRQIIARGGSYGAWNVGASYSPARLLSLDLRYWDTDRHDLGHPFHRHAAIQARVSF